MLILPVIAALFLIGLTYNLATGSDTWQKTVAQIGIATVAVRLYAVFRRERAVDDRFFVWLLRNAEPLRRGAVTYNGTLLTLDTPLRHFEATASFLFISVRLWSRLFLEGPDRHARLGLACTVATLLFGWWGIPWGPIFIVQSLWHNVRGGRRTTVRHELADLGFSLLDSDRATSLT